MEVVLGIGPMTNDQFREFGDNRRSSLNINKSENKMLSTSTNRLCKSTRGKFRLNERLLLKKNLLTGKIVFPFLMILIYIYFYEVLMKVY